MIIEGRVQTSGSGPQPRIQQPADQHRPPWPLVLLVAGLTSSIPILALLAIPDAAAAGPPWRLLAGPLLVGVAVVLSRVRVEAGAVALGITLAALLTPVDVALSVSGVWSTVASMGLFLGLCWVTCCLGMQLPTRWSLLWALGLVTAGAWGVGFDVPIALLGVGWWLVGQTFRHRQQVADRLASRAEELAHEQQRYVAEAVRLERARIARELHDVVAHCMTVIVIQARAGQQLVSADPVGAGEALAAILGSAREAEADIDALVAAMAPDRARPPTRELLETMVRRAGPGVRVRLTIHGDPDDLPPVLAETGQRAVQEALTNALRYAPGADVLVDLRCTDGVLLTVENGAAAGSDLSGVGSGRGLDGLRQRVAVLGGTATWGPRTGGGWRLRVEIPVTPSPEAAQPASRVA